MLPEMVVLIEHIPKSKNIILPQPLYPFDEDAYIMEFKDLCINL